MAIDFIFFGVLFILMIFNFVKFDSVFLNAILIIISLLIVLGYVSPNINLDFISFNLFHLLAFLLSFICFKIKIRNNTLISIFISCLYFLILTIDRDYMFTYNLSLFSILSILPFVVASGNFIYRFGEMFNSLFLMLVINSLFEFDEFNYIAINFTHVFNLLTIVISISIIFVCLSSLISNRGDGFKYEKNSLGFNFNFDF